MKFFIKICVFLNERKYNDLTEFIPHSFDFSIFEVPYFQHSTSFLIIVYAQGVSFPLDFHLFLYFMYYVSASYLFDLSTF